MLDDLYQDSIYRSTWKLSKMSEKDVCKSYRGCHLISIAVEKRPEIPVLWFGFRQHDLEKKRNFYYGIRWKERSDAAKDYRSPELTHLLQVLQTQKVKSGLPFWPAFTWLDFSPFSESFIVSMTNEPKTSVTRLVDDFWRQFVTNAASVEAVNQAAAGEIGSS